MKYDTKQVINEIIEQQTQEQEMFTEMANVAVDEDKNVTLQVNVRDNFNVDYFKFYNHKDYQSATHVARISFYKPEYRIHRAYDGKKTWVLNSKERKKLMQLLNEEGKYLGYNNFQCAIIDFNLERGLPPLKTRDNKVDNPKYPEFLPIDLPMPNYWELR